MAFQEEPTKTPTSLPTIEVVLRDELVGGGEPTQQSAEFRIFILYNDGTDRERRGDLVPHVTPAQRSALMAFMDDLRAQAEEQILP